MLASEETKEKSDIFLKALTLKAASDIESIKTDVSKKMIVILRVTPLAQSDSLELKNAIEKLYEFSAAIGGDIARLGEERIVITPPGVKVWRGIP
jgi:SepF-like predicted cell division protein (DUF552 family)